MSTILPTSHTAMNNPEGYLSLGEARVVASDTASIRVQADQTTVEVSVLAPDLFRVGIFPHGRLISYASHAVLPPTWPRGEIQIAQEEKQITLKTSEASAHLSLNPLRLHFSDHQGKVFAADDQELGMGVFSTPESGIDLLNPVATLGTPVRVYKQHLADEFYFGCGERTGHLNKTDTHQLFWNVDPPRGHTDLQNNLYVSIPFTLVMAQGKAWGMFVDNSGQVDFDLAHEQAERSWFEVNNGNLVYYIFSGPTPQAVLARYTDLTGHTPLPPIWSLGNGQSRFSYETADEIREIANTFREHDIPCDTLYLDIDTLDGYRVFTWNKKGYPDPEGLFKELREQGFHVVSIVDAGVKVDEQFSIYTDGRSRNLYCQTPSGAEYQNAVWPGLCAFPDFTNPEARRWWGEQHRVLLDAGISGIWSDMNEPALFIPTNSTMPNEIIHAGEGQPYFHLQVHNAYGSLMVQAAREGLLKLRPEQRPFVITRAGYAGIQRHALVWTGDNSSTWEHMAMSIPQLQNLGLSGVGWSGVDIGGFYGDATGELLVRWLELGIFQPFCRNHSEKQTRHQEPWVFGESYEAFSRQMLKLRQRLLPYLYTLFDECHRTGAPILRPLFWAYPEDTSTYTIEDQLLCGDTLLIAPILQPGKEYRHVYLPTGTWFHYWTGERVDGPTHLLAHAPLGQPAIYVRANTALPLWPETNYTDPSSIDSISLILYPASGQGTTTLYEDTGDGYTYLNEQFARRLITSHLDKQTLTVTIDVQEGNFTPTRKQIEIEVRTISTTPHEILLNKQPCQWLYHEEQKSIIINLPASPEKQEVSIKLA